MCIFCVGNLTNLKTRSIVPVDLNAILCWNAGLLSEFHARLGDTSRADYYREVRARLLEAIEKVLRTTDRSQLILPRKVLESVISR